MFKYSVYIKEYRESSAKLRKEILIKSIKITRYY